MEPSFGGHCIRATAIRSTNPGASLMAHGFALSAPHDVQGFGMPDGSISTGEMKRKVHAAT